MHASAKIALAIVFVWGQLAAGLHAASHGGHVHSHAHVGTELGTEHGSELARAGDSHGDHAASDHPSHDAPHVPVAPEDACDLCAFAQAPASMARDPEAGLPSVLRRASVPLALAELPGARRSLGHALARGPPRALSA